MNKITQYTIDDWQFEEQSINIIASDVSQNISGICAGDAGSDYDPAAADLLPQLNILYKR